MKVKSFVLNCNNLVLLMKHIFKLINIHFKIIIINLFLNEHIILNNLKCPIYKIFIFCTIWTDI